MKKYYKTTLYQVPEFKGYIETSSGITDYQFDGEKQATSYLDRFNQLMDVIVENTLSPYYVVEKNTGILLPVVYVREDICDYGKALASFYSVKTAGNSPVSTFIVKREVVHKSLSGKRVIKTKEKFYPVRVIDSKTLEEYDTIHQDKEQFKNQLHDILSLANKNMKAKTKTRKKETLPLIYNGF